MNSRSESRTTVDGSKMNIMVGDTIVTEDRQIGIVENRAGSSLSVRFPDCGNQRDQVPRRRAKPLAKIIGEARAEGERLPSGTNISLVGNFNIWRNWWLFSATRPDRCDGIHSRKL